MDTNIKLSTLWVVVLFNMAFADIFTFMLEYSTGHKPEFEVTQQIMLIAAFILEIPIAMIFLSRVFKEGLIKSNKFWQRQISKIKACELGMLIALQVSITQRLGIWLSPAG